MTTPNQREYVEEKIDRKQRDPLLAVVTKVFEHTSSDDFQNHEVNARAIHNEEEFREIPVHTTRHGHAHVPRVGDPVEINFLGSSTQSPYVSGGVHLAKKRAPLAREGHWRHRFGDLSPYLFVEAEKSDHSAGAPDVVRIAKKSDGLSDPTDMVEIDDSGTTTVVNIETDGEIHINGDAQGLITDIDTTTDVDGHVTSVTPVRSSNVLTE